VLSTIATLLTVNLKQKNFIAQKHH
jgi:hypothetical protein